MSNNSLEKDFSSSVKGLMSQASLHEAIPATTLRTFVAGEYPKALRCDGAGVLEFKDADGVVGTYNVLQGEVFSFENITEITANTTIIIHVWW